MTGSAIIWSRWVGTMFQGRCSAATQYSRTRALAVAVAATEAEAALPLAAATRGGTSTPPASRSTSICPSSVLTRWPASVQTKAAPVRPRKERRSSGLGLTAAYFFTVTVSFILVGWIVQM